MREMEVNIWRAPTDNDRRIEAEWRRAGYHRSYARAYTTKYARREDGAVVICSAMSVVAAAVQRLLSIDTVWTVEPSGILSVDMQVRKGEELPDLPRFGLRLFLPRKMDRICYCGLGPGENYVDKCRASYHGQFTATVEELQEDYLRPQENGSHGDCDFVAASGEGRSVAVAGEGFSFQASHYSQEELTQKRHSYELEEGDSTILCIDYKQQGLASCSCGPDVDLNYRFHQKEFRFGVNLLLPCTSVRFFDL